MEYEKLVVNIPQKIDCGFDKSVREFLYKTNWMGGARNSISPLGKREYGYESRCCECIPNLLEEYIRLGSMDLVAKKFNVPKYIIYNGKKVKCRVKFGSIWPIYMYRRIKQFFYPNPQITTDLYILGMIKAIDKHKCSKKDKENLEKIKEMLYPYRGLYIYQSKLRVLDADFEHENLVIRAPKDIKRGSIMYVSI